MTSILEQAEVIRDATEAGENTAQRVGGCLVDIAKKIINESPELSIVDGVVSVGIASDFYRLFLSDNVDSWQFEYSDENTGREILVRIGQNNDSPKTVTWPPVFLWENGAPGQVSSSVGAADVLRLVTFDGGNTFYANLSNDYVFPV